ncbi:uncharacterized protein [Phyllobates terribilis]|uniref:uncharacterized protein isoform X1 n=1 Tax=Phyllobates terribilis TaxID=111132 RepID=UPI003CCB45BF
MISSNFFTICFCMLLPALHLTSGNKPQIRAFPSKVMRKGGNVTIKCSSEENQGRFCLLKANTSPPLIDGDAVVFEQNFTVINVQEHNSTDYYCYQLLSNNMWSDPSDFLTLEVIDMKKPNISACIQNGTEKTYVLINCTTPRKPKKGRIAHFSLYSGSVLPEDLAVYESSPEGTFRVPDLTAVYRCSYALQVESHLIESLFSKKVIPTTVTQKCKDDVQTTSINNDEKEPTDDNDDVLIPVVAAACGALCLILVVILVLYFMRKNKSSSKIETNSILPESEQVESRTDPTYCTVDECKMRPTTDMMVDMKDTVVSEDNYDGITYAKLNNDSLKKKDSQPDKPTDTCLYAVVKKNKPK